MKITVNIQQLDLSVMRQLSVIGKRAVRKDGESRFSDITPSSAETEAFHDYYLDAVTLVNTSAQYFVTASTSPNAAGTSAVGEITLTFPTNHNNNMDTTITVAFTTFLVAYAVYAWLSIVEPSLVERYKAAMREKLEALVLLIFHKSPPNQGYTDSLPPMVSTPGDTLTLSPGEQRNIAYTIGSDGVDDLSIYSTNGNVTVTKNTVNQVFSIINANSGEDSASAVVTIVHGNNEELARISVTALGSAGGQASSDPIIIGYNPVSDTINIERGSSITVSYSGTIATASSSSNAVSVNHDSSTKKLLITGNDVGSCEVTLVGNNGRWIYKLYVTVYKHEATVRYHNVGVGVGEDITFNLPFGHSAHTYQMSPTGIATFSDDMDEGTLTISGSTAGQCELLVTETDSGDMYIYFIEVSSSQQSDIMPAVYGYSSGDTINMQTGGVVYLNYFAGSKGSMVVSSSDSSKVTVGIDGENHLVTVRAVASGSATVTFKNNTLSWTLTLRINVAAEQAPIESPTLTYTIGNPAGQTPTLLSNYVTLSTSEDIYVRAAGGSGATMFFSSVDSSKASVSYSGGYYIIHPITGTTTVKFEYGDEVWNVVVTKPQDVTIPYIITSARNFSLNNNEYVNIDINLGSFTVRDITSYLNNSGISLSSIEDREDGTARLKVTCTATETKNTSFNIEFNPEDSVYYEDRWEETFYVSCNPSTPTPTPTPTVRYQDVTINVGGDVTYALPFGASAQTYQLSPSGYASFSDDMDELTITIYGNVAGSCQLAVTETDSGDQYIYRITVTSSGGGGGIIPSSGYAYGYINGTFVNDSLNCVNPVVQVSSTGEVKACIYNGSYLCKYENQQFGQGLYANNNIRPNNVVDEAVRLAANDYGVVLTPVYNSQITIEGNETISFSLDE